ncbi:hypothetical protein [Piscirickettsia salmonis]|nr:hypothetical protein [Piscirickettsia salmonis]
MSYSSDYVEFSKAFLKLPTQEASFMRSNQIAFEELRRLKCL